MDTYELFDPKSAHKNQHWFGLKGPKQGLSFFKSLQKESPHPKPQTWPTNVHMWYE